MMRSLWTAASGMRVLSNAVFKMDDTCRTYYELETDVNLENAVRRVMDNSKYDFTQNKSRDNATSYMQAVNMYKRVVLQGYDYVINMLEVKASAPATQWFDWFNHDYSECIKLIDDIGNSKETALVSRCYPLSGLDECICTPLYQKSLSRRTVFQRF